MSASSRMDETLVSGPASSAAWEAEEHTAPARATAELPAGQRQILAGRYQLLSLLGSGAMGSVYRARDLELGEDVAVKVLRRELLDSPAMVERFRNEVKLARRVTHRNVARTFDIGEHDGEKFLTMELVEGEPLSHRIHRDQIIALPVLVEIAAAVCAGLGAAHAAGVVHRDLKPDNVLLAPDGRVVITDFGIARGVLGSAAHQTQGGILGTPAYMAPEQVEAREVDARADIYALGCMLYEMLTGQVPWDGDSPIAVAMARLVRPPPDPRAVRPEVPEAAAHLVLRCLQRQPQDRFASAAEVGAALAQLTQPVLAAAPAARTAPPGPAAALPTATGARTLAVLPFRNGGPPEDDYLAAGLCEDLTDTLSMTRGLRVRPRGAVQAVAQGGEGDPRAHGERLGVEVVVEGSLRRSGDRVRVQVRLTGVSDGFQLWAQRFDRPAADVLAVGEEAAQAIAQALMAEPQPQAARAPLDPRAMDLYLRARHAYHMPTGASTMRAVDLLEQALAVAPEDSSVLTLYALARARLWFMGVEGSEERARAAADRAMRAAPERGESYLALATVRYQEGDLPEAVRLLRQGIVLAPGLADAHELLGRILIECGPLDQGINELGTALGLDPGLLRAPVDLARAHALRGDRKEALRYLTRLKLAPESTFGWITQARLAMWFRDQDLAAECLAQPQLDLPAMRQMAELVLSERADRDLDEVFASWFGRHSSGRGRAFYMQVRTEAGCLVRDLDGAFRGLGEAVAAGLTDLNWLQLCPLLAELRADPRFAPLRAVVAERAARVRAAL